LFGSRTVFSIGDSSTCSSRQHRNTKVNYTTMYMSKGIEHTYTMAKSNGSRAFFAIVLTLLNIVVVFSPTEKNRRVLRHALRGNLAHSLFLFFVSSDHSLSLYTKFYACVGVCMCIQYIAFQRVQLLKPSIPWEWGICLYTHFVCV